MTIEQSSSTKSSVLLIDIDNCPKQIENLPHTIDQFTHVVACYGGVEPKIPLNLVTFLAKAINEGNLEIIAMRRKGKNAADFGLTFWAGKLMSELPSDTDFVILSQDTDLNHAIDLLQSAGRKAIRIDGKIKNININSIKNQNDSNNKYSIQFVDEIEEYYYQILQPGKARPRKRNTLQNNIKSYFKKRKDIKPEEIIKGLLEKEFIKFDAQGRVIYSNTELELPF